MGAKGNPTRTGNEYTGQSIEHSILKQSLPELSDAAFDKVYRQFFIRAHLELLGYEARGEDWDDILDCFAAERERRYGRVASKL